MERTQYFKATIDEKCPYGQLPEGQSYTLRHNSEIFNNKNCDKDFMIN